MKWNGKTSNHFKIYDEVKQGTILFPQLFSIYIDSLFSMLRKIGCWLGGSYIGIVGLQMFYSSYAQRSAGNDKNL